MVPLGFLSSGEAVVDRHQSHIHSTATLLLPAALQKIDARGRDFCKEVVDFGRVIGETTCVGTGPNDRVVYARRPKRSGLSRFVMNRIAEPCSRLVVILKKGDRDEYILITTFVGDGAEPEPWDRNATAASREFWSKKALVWGSEEALCHECGDALPADPRAVALVGDLVFCVPCARENQGLDYAWGVVQRRAGFPGWGELNVP